MTALLILFAILNACDGWTTWQALRFGAKELNPLVRWWFGLVGRYNALLILKVGIVAAMWYFNPFTQTQFWVVDAGYAALIVWNYIQLLKQKEKAK